ncbi:DNA-3-methyladenine glycosylase family protein [Virgibacillus ihumii]|uniref:DNA-3-methyladenine glycosylase family protein n=1 Tax=Virgibacillus ihumii TaxID=2686091 RepID=UPI00157DC49F|nr:DNA-3-methyladenine glycosylase 2 family protein [Virgibacillus ihumii]
MNTLIVKQNDSDTAELCKADKQMEKLIQAIGNVETNMRSDFFKSLVRSMIGQQISVHAAQAIFTRLETLLNNNFTADSMLNAPDENLREIGLSSRKVIYLRDLAEKVKNQEVNLDTLSELDNHEVIRQLTSIKGIGKWTAEMFLIFSLGRMNVLAVDDIGIQRGAKWLYGVAKSERRNILLEKEPVWNPYLTRASLYLWEVVHLDFEKKYANVDEALEAENKEC